MADDIENSKKALFDHISDKDKRFYAKGALERHLYDMVNHMANKEFVESGQTIHIEPNSPEYREHEKIELDRLIGKASTDGAARVMADIQKPDAVRELISAIKNLSENQTLDALYRVERARDKALDSFRFEKNPKEAFTNAYAEMSKDKENTVDFAKKTWRDRDNVLIAELQKQHKMEKEDLSSIARAIDSNHNGKVDGNEENRIWEIAQGAFGRLFSDEERNTAFCADTISAAEKIEKAIAALEPYRGSFTHVEVAPAPVAAGGKVRTAGPEGPK